MQAPPENEAPRGRATGLRENVHAGGLDASRRKPNPTDLQAAAKEVLARHTSDLAVIADWREELHAKIRRAQMRLELVDLDLEEQHLLADEVLAFKQLCLAIMASWPTATPTACAATRRAP